MLALSLSPQYLSPEEVGSVFQTHIRGIVVDLEVRRWLKREGGDKALHAQKTVCPGMLLLKIDR